MSLVETIKQQILMMEQGIFQNMCNALLAKEGYGIIMSLGSQAGTQKTTKGTPDTYFVRDNGQYVFVEYTTQQSNIADKIRDDINKCFDVDKTKVPLDKISEIVYCHTSSNLTPGDDHSLRKLCADNGTILTLYGIDELASRLYLLHREIAQEYLGISVGTGQIKEIQQFIKDYDANTLSAPLDTPFLYREKEMEQIENAFQSANVVILTGRAGVGKSRLALHYSEAHAKQHQETLYCIRSNAQPLYEDLIQHINVPGNYFLFVDDANELSAGLQHILEFATGKDPNYNVRVLITVRDYAAELVYRVAKPLVYHATVDIPVFSDEQIKNLVQDNYDITNPDYLERIVRIAEGNARIAMLAGNIAKKADRLQSINDLTSLFADYYGTALTEKGLITDRKLLTSAGITAFLSPFDCKRIDPILPVLQQCSLSKDDFIEKLYELHEKEIIEIHYNQIVRFDEQCLGNYVLKRVFVDDKYICLSEMIRCCFEYYRSKTIQAINTICGVFQSPEVIDYVEQQITLLWNALEKEHYPHFHEYVKTFHGTNPTAALLYIQDFIDASVENKEIPSHEEIQKGKNYQSVSDDILTMLGGFADTTYLDEALDLFFMYYSKCYGKFLQFYHTVQTYYNINRRSHRIGYYTQNHFIKKLKEFSNNWNDEPIRLLFTELAPKLLMLEHTATEGGRGRQFTFYRMEIAADPAALEYRAEIWQCLRAIASFGDLSCLEKALEEYGNGYSDNGKEVIISESSMIASLVSSLMDPSNLKHCLIADHLIRIWSECDCVPAVNLKSFTDSSIMQCYRVLKGPGHKTPYEQREEIQKAQIAQYMDTNRLEGLRALIDTCVQFYKTGRNTWDVENGLRFAFDSLQLSDDIVSAIKYYISRDTPLCLYPVPLVEQLFRKCTVTEVHQIIFESDYGQKNMWQFSYFVAYPAEKISTDIVAEFYAFMSNTSDSDITPRYRRELWFIEKFEKNDPHVFINIGTILHNKFKFSPVMVGLYCESLFNENRHAAEAVIQKFTGHFELLAKLYIQAVSRGSLLSDYQGVFARTFMRAYPPFINIYAQYLADMIEQHKGDKVHEHLISFFDEENAHCLLDHIVDTVIVRCEYAYFDLPKLFEELLLPEQEKDALKQKQSNWIRHLISQYADDALRMSSLFETIAQFSDDRRIEYILLYLEHNPSYDDFIKLPLMPRLLSWSNSAVPMYSRHKECLAALSKKLTGVKYLGHRQYVLDRVAGLQAEIEREQLRDLLEV